MKYFESMDPFLKEEDTMFLYPVILVMNRFFLLPEGISMQNVWPVKFLYADTDLEPFMLQATFRMPNEKTLVKALDMDFVKKHGTEVKSLEELTHGIRFYITQTDLFPEDDEHFWFCYEARDEDVTLSRSMMHIKRPVLSVIKVACTCQAVEWEKAYLSLLAISYLEKRVKKLSNLPKASRLPQPLRDVVYEQYQSTEGMYFQTISGPLSPALEQTIFQLQHEIIQYHLEDVLEVNSDEEAILSGEPVITAYLDLSTRFNFI